MVTHPDDRSGSLVRQVAKIISGGQTGVDRAALDVAARLNIPRGGWCPLGRLAEDGHIPENYPLHECESQRYEVRTQRNVIEADATLILAREPLSGGTALTRRLAGRHGKPHLLINPQDSDFAAERVRQWLAAARVKVLNVAGPRESQQPGIYEATVRFLLGVFGP